MKIVRVLIIILMNCIGSIVLAQPLANDEHYKASISYFNEGLTPKAIQEINAYLAIRPSSTEALLLRAFYYIQLDESEKALADYEKVLFIDPNNDDALTNRALLFMELGEYQSALTDINTRLDNNPNSWSIYFDRAYCYGLNGDHNLAIKDFDKSITLNPDHASSYANRGFSKINDLSNEGLIRPAPEQCIDACIDLRKALALGDSTVVRSITLYCPEKVK